MFVMEFFTHSYGFQRNVLPCLFSPKANIENRRALHNCYEGQPFVGSVTSHDPKICINRIYSFYSCYLFYLCISIDYSVEIS